MKTLILLSLITIINCSSSAQAQPDPEDSTPLSTLPFDYDTFCKEKLNISLYEDFCDTENFCERLLSDTTALGKAVASQLHSVRTTYMVLVRCEKFTLYLFQLSRMVEGQKRRLIPATVLATVKDGSILSVLEQPLNNERTFTVMPDLIVNVYNARMEERMFGNIVGAGVGWIPVKEHKIAAYTIDNKGNFTKHE